MADDIPPPPEGFELVDAAPPPPPAGFAPVDDIPPPPAGFQIVPPQPEHGALVRGLLRMVPTTAANLAQGGAVAARVVGAPETGTSLENLGNRLETSANAAAPRLVPDIEHIHDTGTLLTWAGETLGEQSGSILASAISGLAGAGVGAVLGSARALPFIGRAFGLLTATRGAAGGAAIGSFIQNSGDTFNNIRQNTPSLDPDTAAMWAAAAGVPMAALDVYSLHSLLSPLLPHAANTATRSLLTRIATGIPKGAATEGVTETAQEAISIVAEQLATGQPIDLTTPRAQSRLLNNAAGGVLLGGVARGTTEALGMEGHGQQPPPPPPPGTATPGATPGAPAGAPPAAPPPAAAVPGEVPIPEGTPASFAPPGSEPPPAAPPAAAAVDVPPVVTPAAAQTAEPAAPEAPPVQPTAPVVPQPAAAPVDVPLPVAPAAAQSAPASTPTEPAPPPGSAAGPNASVPFMITRQMKRKLADLGWEPAAISEMTPERAHQVLARSEQPAPVSTPATPQAAAPADVPMPTGPLASEQPIGAGPTLRDARNASGGDQMAVIRAMRKITGQRDASWGALTPEQRQGVVDSLRGPAPAATAPTPAAVDAAIARGKEDEVSKAAAAVGEQAIQQRVIDEIDAARAEPTNATAVPFEPEPVPTTEGVQPAEPAAPGEARSVGEQPAAAAGTVERAAAEPVQGRAGSAPTEALPTGDGNVGERGAAAATAAEPSAKPAGSPVADRRRKRAAAPRAVAEDSGPGGVEPAKPKRRRAKKADAEVKHEQAAPAETQFDPTAALKAVRVLARTLKRKAPGASAAFVQRLQDSKGNRVTGSYSSAQRLIAVAMERAANDSTPAHTVNHEIIHYLRDAGLITTDEWSMLEKHAGENGWVTDALRAKYPGLSESQLTEEAIANVYARWAGGQPKGLSGAILRAFRRIHEFFRGLRADMENAGFKSAVELFRAIDTGTVGRRTAPTSEPVSDTKFQRPAVPPTAPPNAAPPGAPGQRPTGGPATPPRPGPIRRSLATTLSWLHNTLIPKWVDDAFASARDALAPMAGGGSDLARAAAKNAANWMRWIDHQVEWVFKDWRKRLTPEEDANVFNALDKAHVDHVTGVDLTGKALSTLTPKERAVADASIEMMQAQWQRARAAGVVPDIDPPSPYYMHRELVRVLPDGTVQELPRGGNSKMSRDIDDFVMPRFSTQGTHHRKNLTVLETEQGAQAKFDDTSIRVARTVTANLMAWQRMEHAIAAKNLVKTIKAYGAALQVENVTDQPNTGFFKLDHPAFYEFRPRLEKHEDGTVSAVHDDSGDTIFDRVPIYVSKDFEAPLRAILTKPNAAGWYRALMAMKYGGIRMVMFSPLMHAQLEWGRTMPLLPGKTLTGRVLTDADNLTREEIREFYLAGIAPPGHSGFKFDIDNIAQGASLDTSKGLITRSAQALGNHVSQRVGRMLGTASEKTGDLLVRKPQEWLWGNFIPRLQLGIAVNMRDQFMAKGLPREIAVAVAAHLANRYAGAIPRESMSEKFRNLSNILFFSRSLTFGNFGVGKDVFTGLPRDVQSVIRQQWGPRWEQYASALAANKALRSLVGEMAVKTLANAVFQHIAMAVGVGALGAGAGGAFLGRKFGVTGMVAGAAAGVVISGALAGTNLEDEIDRITRGYTRRWRTLMREIGENPLHALNPFAVETLLPTGENDRGKHGRVMVGHNREGTAIYSTNPVGRVGEDIEGYIRELNVTLGRKMSQMVRAIYGVMWNDNGLGRQLRAPDGFWHSMGRTAEFLVDQFLPTQPFYAAYDLATEGRRDSRVNAARIVAPAVGLSISQGYPGGVSAGEAAGRRRDQIDLRTASQPAITRLLQAGDIDEARASMTAAGLTPQQQAIQIRSYGPGASPAARYNTAAAREYLRTATPEQRERFEEDRARAAARATP